MIVCKFGGSSVASLESAQKIKDITNNKNRKIIVVSALGKTKQHNFKVTDKLFLLYDLLTTKKNYINLLDEIFFRYEELSQKLKININWNKYKTEFIKTITTTQYTKEFIVSRGEYYSAILYAKFLEYKFLDAKNYIIFNKNGKINRKLTQKMLKNIDLSNNYVIGGYYGSNKNGNICIFDRGGSDITGAIICNLLNFQAYENYTDVNGIYNKSPTHFNGAKQLKFIPYKTAIAMANYGTEVVHKDAIAEMINAIGNLVVKNTNMPELPGTTILKSNFCSSNLFISFEKIKIMEFDKPFGGCLNIIKNHATVKHIYFIKNKYFYLIKNFNNINKKDNQPLKNAKIYDSFVFTIFSENKINKKILKNIKKTAKILKKYNILCFFSHFFNNFIIVCKHFEFGIVKSTLNDYLQKF